MTATTQPQDNQTANSADRHDQANAGNDEEDRLAATAAGLTEEERLHLISYHSFDNFKLLHRPQLEALRMPQSLWPKLYDKIYNETFDLEAFDESADSLRAVTDLLAGADIYLFEHVWSADATAALRQFVESEELCHRVAECVERARAVVGFVASADDDNVSLIVAECSISAAAAVELLKSHRGDIVAAVSEANALSAAAKRAVSVWFDAFSCDVISAVFTTRPRSPTATATALRAADIDTTYFIADERSILPQAPQPNAVVAPIVVVTLNGATFTALWLTADVVAGDVITRPQRRAVPTPPWPQQSELI